jgi:hypothetical protein
MSHHEGAFALAEAQVAALSDDPVARLALMARLFRGPTGRAPRHVPFRLAALSFMRWQAQRGERFFMNVALLRVLYAHVLVGAPCLALGRLGPLGRLLGDPRLGTAGVFLSLGRVVPNRYPLALGVERYVADEHRLGRMLDYAVIVPRLQRLYEWSAQDLDEPRLLELIRDGYPVYAWPFEQRQVWRSPNMSLAGRALERATRAR